MFIFSLPNSDWTWSYEIDKFFPMVATWYGLNFPKLDPDPFCLHRLVAESDLDCLRKVDHRDVTVKDGHSLL